MSAKLETQLARWTSAGVIDALTADRISRWEQEHQQPGSLRWPVLIALAFGALLLCAGVLLFVSAHWDELSPGGRMSLVVAMVGAFHAGGVATAGRSNGLSIALHTAGTFALGAGIALTGQIFHLSAHWPGAILLWAAGASLAWLLLGHWTQAALTAILVPYWLSGEWSVFTFDAQLRFLVPVSAGICALSMVYLGARRSPEDSPARKALGWIGGIALIPAAAATAAQTWTALPSWQVQLLAWSIATVGPLVLAMFLRGRDAVWAAIAIVWTLLLVAANGGHGDRLVVYVWCALGATGVAFWGIRESRPERINLGILGFAVTVLAYYFSNVMDKLSRSASLIAVGLLLLGGGWLLEHMRRQLLNRIDMEAK